MWQELSSDGYQIDGWRCFIDVNPSGTGSEPVGVELQAGELDVEVVNEAGRSQSIDVNFDSALSDRGRKGNNQYDDEH